MAHETHSFSVGTPCRCGVSIDQPEAAHPCRLSMRKWEVRHDGKKVGEVFSLNENLAGQIAVMAYGKRDYELIEKENK